MTQKSKLSCKYAHLDIFEHLFLFQVSFDFKLTFWQNLNVCSFSFPFQYETLNSYLFVNTYMYLLMFDVVITLHVLFKMIECMFIFESNYTEIIKPLLI